MPSALATSFLEVPFAQQGLDDHGFHHLVQLTQVDFQFLIHKAFVSLSILDDFAAGIIAVKGVITQSGAF